MQIQYFYVVLFNTLQESHAATSALCKYICKPQFLHAFAYASPCKPMQARCKSRASSCRRMRPEPNHSQCCQMFKKDESRLLEVVGSFPSMCLHVSVLCLDAWQHLNLLVHRACILQARCTCICKHDAKICSDFSDMQVHMHRACIVFG